MQQLKISTLEAGLIVVFGVFHFTLPLLLPPNFISDTTIFGGLRIADFVLPGTLLVGITSLLYFFTKNRYPAAILVFLYCGGITFHILYLTGLFPAVLVVPSPWLLVGGIFIDALTIFACFDYYRRIHQHL
ncbi:MAG: hypothetical protein NWE92_03690 [Candidatus Bathyarchaeota archaeon]|nr:hypothetical protein [Candidatus Bathyarchaeota archaeon]